MKNFRIKAMKYLDKSNHAYPIFIKKMITKLLGHLTSDSETV